MNREIKFRAWDKEIKVMRDWNYLQTIPQTALWTASDLDLMQYTGLLDKNGKEIFEGDIVRFEDTITDVVEWSDRLASWYTKNGASLGAEMGLTDRNPEVIGNIYENPNLLNHA